MTLITRIRCALADAARAHEVLWDVWSRIDPDPDPYLHWEPTTHGWRLYGTIAPPCDVCRFG